MGLCFSHDGPERRGVLPTQAYPEQMSVRSSTSWPLAIVAHVARGSLRALVLVAVLWCSSPVIAAAQPGEAADSEPETPDYAAALASAVDAGARKQVAFAFLRSIGEDSDEGLPAAWLAQQPAAAVRLLAETAQGQEQLESLVDALVRSLRSVPEDQPNALALGTLSPDASQAAIEILARSQRPRASELLIDWLAVAQRRDRASIVQALVAMTGRDDFGASVPAWREWLTRNRHLPPLAWRSMLLDGVRERAARLERRQRELTSRLAENSRRIYVVLPADQRSAYLVSLLNDGEPTLRSVGNELVLRELERGALPGPDVGAAVIGLLDDPVPALRQSAAVLVDRIVPEGSAARLTMALRRESEPEIAAVMLRAFRRSPDSAAIDAVLRWREYGPPTSEDALWAVVALLRNDFTPTGAQRERLLATIDPTRPAELSVAAVTVLDRLGGDAGREAIVELLTADRADLRRAAADTLAAYAWAVEPLLRAAAADPSLLPRAADAIVRHTPSAAFLVRVARIERGHPVGEPTAGSGGAMALPMTTTLARLLPWGERIAAAFEMVDHPRVVQAILGNPIRSEFAEGPLGDEAFARAQALLSVPSLGEDGDVVVADAGQGLESENQTDELPISEPKEADPQPDAGPTDLPASSPPTDPGLGR